MGQYYKICNLDKKQYLHPRRFGDGLKLLEFSANACGTMTGLAVLLASGNNRGGGDLRSSNPIIGSWSGDRIVIAGDYDDKERWLERAELDRFQNECQDEIRQWHEHHGSDRPYPITLYDYASRFYQDISNEVLLAMADDTYLREELARRLEYRRGDPFAEPLPKELVQKVYGATQ